MPTSTPGQISPSSIRIFFLIVLLNIVVYFPSLFHVARGDQITYLAEIATKNIWETTLGNYDYNRTRIFCPGDEILFRPVLFIFMGIEKIFFGYNFAFWQATGIILHLIALWCLWRLLLSFHQSIFAGLLTAFFSISAATYEMVIWHGINGYLICIILILIILRELNHRPLRLGLITFCLLIACFTYEIANLYAVLFFFYLWLLEPTNRRRSLILLLPPLIYGITSLINLGTLPAASVSDKTTLGINLLTANLFWIKSGIFSDQIHFLPTGNSWNIITGKTLSTPGGWIWVITATGMIGIYFLILRKTVWKELDRQKRLFISLLMAMIVVFTAVILLGRAGSPDMTETYLTKRSYYGYLPWMLWIILGYGLINFNGWKNNRYVGLFKTIITGCLITLTLLQGYLTFSHNRQLAQLHQDRRNLIRAMKQNKILSTQENIPGNEEIPFLFRADDPSRRYRFLEALYP